MTIPPETLHIISGLPGEELVLPGLRDILAGKLRSTEALLVTIARTRLNCAGLGFLDAAELGRRNPDPESLLYQALCSEDPESAYGRYNSMKRRLDSFIRSLELRQAREVGGAGSEEIECGRP